MWYCRKWGTASNGALQLIGHCRQCVSAWNGTLQAMLSAWNVALEVVAMGHYIQWDNAANGALQVTGHCR